MLWFLHFDSGTGMWSLLFCLLNLTASCHCFKPDTAGSIGNYWQIQFTKPILIMRLDGFSLGSTGWIIQNCDYITRLDWSIYLLMYYKYLF